MREFRFVLTPFCNYKCFFCHAENICEDVTLLLRPSDYAFMAETAKTNLGWNTATITGGEPLISPIFLEVCEAFKVEGIDVTVVTNASLLARPAEMLRNVSQVNISLHTLNPETYKEITQIGYPLEEILNTIRKTRKQLPDLIIHLNYTVIKGMNDKDEDFEKLFEFSKEVKATPKLIDLSSSDENIATDADEIVSQLKKMGFELKTQTAWQFKLARNDVEVIVTKCPFNGKHTDEPIRDIFVEPNGIMYTSYSGTKSINALENIKSRNSKGLIEQITNLLQGS